MACQNCPILRANTWPRTGKFHECTAEAVHFQRCQGQEVLDRTSVKVWKTGDQKLLPVAKTLPSSKGRRRLIINLPVGQRVVLNNKGVLCIRRVSSRFQTSEKGRRTSQLHSQCNFQVACILMHDGCGACVRVRLHKDIDDISEWLLPSQSFCKQKRARHHSHPVDQRLVRQTVPAHQWINTTPFLSYVFMAFMRSTEQTVIKLRLWMENTENFF
eukprot:scaffold209932_cov13-Tisochrysis_lutea.AAC.1